MMLGAGLSMDQAPPVLVPYRFFLTAPFFGVLAGVLLSGFGAGVLASRFSLHLFGLVHLLTLGFITMVMQGALFQMLPVLAGTPFRNVGRNSFWIYVSYLPGVLLLTAGFLLDMEWLLGPAIFFLVASLLSFIVLFFRTIGTARVENDSVRAMRHAVFSLAVLLSLGAVLGFTHFSSFDVPVHPIITEIHMGWALGGWVGILIMGVSFQVLPMFYVTPEYPRWMRRWISPAVLFFLVLWSAVSLSGGREGLTTTSWANLLSLLATTPYLIYSVTTLVLLQKRLRKIFEINVLFFRFAMLFLLLSILSYATSLVLGPSVVRERVVVVTGLLYIYGFAISVINGMLYRIVPFLAWFHLMGRGIPDAPNMREILPSRFPTIQLALHGIAILLLIAGSLTGSSWITVVAGLTASASFLLLGVNLFRVLRLYRKHSRKGNIGIMSELSGQSP